MGKLGELKTLAKGYMAQKKEIRAKDDELRQLQSTKELVTDLVVQGGSTGTDVNLFLARAQDKMTQMSDKLEATEVEKDALQRSMARISVELSNAQTANASLSEENAKLRELLAQSKGDMYEMLHNESKGNLTELAELRSENVTLKADKATLERELADAKKVADTVPALHKELDEAYSSLEKVRQENKKMQKELKIYQAQKTTAVNSEGGDILLG